MTGKEKLKLPQVLAEIGCSRAAFYRWRARGLAPKCSKIPSGEIRVSREDLDAWWASREEVA
jgi:predicted DNA-binding transcriptional regulator AlpA